MWDLASLFSSWPLTSSLSEEEDQDGVPGLVQLNLFLYLLNSQLPTHYSHDYWQAS